MSSSRADLAEIISALQNPEAVERGMRNLHQLYGRRLLAFFRAKGSSGQDAEDLTQETLFRVFQKRGGLRDPTAFEPWLLKIAQHTHVNAWRKRSAAKRDGKIVAIDGADQPVADDAFDHLAFLSNRPEDPQNVLISAERKEKLKAAILSLPEKKREILILRIYHERTYQEISQILDISINTVKAHLNQASERLKQLFARRADRLDL